MKKTALLLSVVVLLGALPAQDAGAQSFIRKLKNKTEDAVIDKMFDDDKNEGQQGDAGNDANSPSNKRGSGLSAASIDVKQSIADAEKSFNDKEYSSARSSIREAIQGIELEIGENILEGMPDEIAGLPVLSGSDQVTSSGIGFVGLIIERTYRSGDQELRVSIGNDSGMLSAVNMYLASGGYATSSDEEENWKKTKFQDKDAIIEYDEYSGYKLSVPFGQSSVLVTEGVNFDSEEAFMDASNEIDLENIKKQLGEQ